MTTRKRICCMLAAIVVAVGCWARRAGDVKPLYDRLDSLISRQADITRAKQQRIQVIRDGLADPTLTDAQRYKIYERLYNEYVAFRYDSAYKYVTANIAIQRAPGGDELLLARSRMQLAHILSVTGMFEQAGSVLDSINVRRLEGDDLAEFYTQRSELYLFKAEFSTGTAYFKAYNDSAQKYRKLIFATASHDSYAYQFNHATYIGEQEYTGEAIQQLEAYLERVGEGDRQYSIVTSTLAYFYGQRHQPEEQEYYLLLSAISDVRGAIRENNSLRELSVLLLNKGDLNRAFLYIKTSVADAVWYGTRLRNLQAAQLAPHITNLYNEAQERQQRRTTLLLVAMSVFALLLIGGLSVIWQLLKKRRAANRKIRTINDQLSALNVELNHVNGQMKESNKIKDEYLGRLLELCSAYIDRADEQRKLENRLARDKRMPELYAELKNPKYIAEATQLFYQNFDTAFLNIYPRFVDEVNRLLMPEHRIETMASEKLTTELRILALLRLGISDNQKIASILRASITTIYTYRSKLKAKAVDKENFESRIRLIESY